MNSRELFLKERYERANEICNQMEELSPSQKEYAELSDELEKTLAAIERTEKLMLEQKRFDMEKDQAKIENEMKADQMKNDMAIKEAQIKVDQQRVESENKKAKVQKFVGVLTAGSTIGVALLATLEGVWGTKRITKYEETGAVTSKAYQGTIHKPKWKF